MFFFLKASSPKKVLKKNHYRRPKKVLKKKPMAIHSFHRETNGATCFKETMVIHNFYHPPTGDELGGFSIGGYQKPPVGGLR